MASSVKAGVGDTEEMGMFMVKGQIETISEPTPFSLTTTPLRKNL